MVIRFFKLMRLDESFHFIVNIISQKRFQSALPEYGGYLSPVISGMVDNLEQNITYTIFEGLPFAI